MIIKISLKKSRKKSKRRSKGGLKPSNRKHLGSDNEIQNFPQPNVRQPQKKLELSEEVKRYENQKQRRSVKREILYHLF